MRCKNTIKLIAVYRKLHIFALCNNISISHMENIGLFCSASNDIDPKYFEAARKLGEWMGKEHKTLIYGGANLGLMECAAIAAKENGGYVIGVVPEILEETGRISEFPDEIINTHNLSDRKDIITQKSDILIALPGGLGTLDEIFHVMAACTIGYHKKKVILYNVAGFYDNLIALLTTLDENKFTRNPISTYYETANTLDEIKSIVNSHKN